MEHCQVNKRKIIKIITMGPKRNPSPLEINPIDEKIPSKPERTSLKIKRRMMMLMISMTCEFIQI